MDSGRKWERAILGQGTAEESTDFRMCRHLAMVSILPAGQEYSSFEISLLDI